MRCAFAAASAQRPGKGAVAVVFSDPYRRARPVSPGVTAGAVIGVVVVLWWRWVRAALWGAVLAMAAVGALRLLVGAEATGDRLDGMLAGAFLLGYAGLASGVLVWWRRAGRPGWLGRRWWAVYVLGGIAVGALDAVAVVGVAPSAGLAGIVIGALLGLGWALMRHAAGSDRTRDTEQRRSMRSHYHPVAEDEVGALLRRIGLKDEDPGPSPGVGARRRPR